MFGIIFNLIKTGVGAAFKIKGISDILKIISYLGPRKLTIGIFEAIVTILFVRKEEIYKKNAFYRFTVIFLLLTGTILVFVIATVSLGTIGSYLIPTSGGVFESAFLADNFLKVGRVQDLAAREITNCLNLVEVLDIKKIPELETVKNAELEEIASLKSTRNFLATGTIISTIYISWQVIRYYNNIPGLVEIFTGVAAATPNETVKVGEENIVKEVSKMAENIQKDPEMANTYKAISKAFPENLGTVEKVNELLTFGEVGVGTNKTIEIKRVVNGNLTELDKENAVIKRVNPENLEVNEIEVLLPKFNEKERFVIVTKENGQIVETTSLKSGVEAVSVTNLEEKIPNDLLNGEKVPATHIANFNIIEENTKIDIKESKVDIKGKSKLEEGEIETVVVNLPVAGLGKLSKIVKETVDKTQFWNLVKTESQKVVEAQSLALTAKTEFSQVSLSSNPRQFTEKYKIMQEADSAYAIAWKKTQERLQSQAEKLNLGPELKMAFTSFEGYPSILKRFGRENYTPFDISVTVLGQAIATGDFLQVAADKSVNYVGEGLGGIVKGVAYVVVGGGTAIATTLGTAYVLGKYLQGDTNVFGTFFKDTRILRALLENTRVNQETLDLLKGVAKVTSKAIPIGLVGRVASLTGNYSNFIFSSEAFLTPENDLGPLQKEAVNEYKKLFLEATENKELEELAKRPFSHILAIELEKRAEAQFLEAKFDKNLTENQRGIFEANLERYTRIIKENIKK